jgi:hypothetical protein
MAFPSPENIFRKSLQKYQHTGTSAFEIEIKNETILRRFLVSRTWKIHTGPYHKSAVNACLLSESHFTQSVVLDGALLKNLLIEEFPAINSLKFEVRMLWWLFSGYKSVTDSYFFFFFFLYPFFPLERWGGGGRIHSEAPVASSNHCILQVGD